MRLFDALGYAHAECGKIVGIRNGKKRFINYSLLEAGEVPPEITGEDFLLDGWEIGWDRVDEDTGALYIEWTDYYGN